MFHFSQNHQGIKGITAIIYARLVQATVSSDGNATGEICIDGCAAHQYWKVVSALSQFIDDQCHLLAGIHQQSAQPNGIRFCFNCCCDDLFGRNLFTQIDNLVTVICQNCFNQVLANVMHIAVHGGQHNSPFTTGLTLFQILFQMGDSSFHHFRRLQHKGQNDLPFSKTLAYQLHGWQKDRVENLESIFVHSGFNIRVHQFINFRFNAILNTVDYTPG